MLGELVGAQIISIDEKNIRVKLNDVIHTLEIICENGGCCGYAEFKMNLIYDENNCRNPIITNIKTEENDFGCGFTSVVTFFGESKVIASLESEASSESGYEYGACVMLRCKTLGVDKTLASW